MSWSLGLDIGVTNTKAAGVRPDGTVLFKTQEPTQSERADWPGLTRKLVERLIGEHGRPAAIGVAAPGIASPDGRCIAWMRGRLGEVEGLVWREQLSWAADVPVLNDAQAALVGEAWIGAAAGAQNVVLLTLGTGVGGATICDGRLLRGHIGRAGHLGHISLDAYGTKDITHTPGSLEWEIGNYSIEQRTNGRFATTFDLVQAVERGDERAIVAWERSIRALAAGAVSLVNVLDPEYVVIGGGIAAVSEGLMRPLRKWMDEFEWRPHGAKTNVVLAALGEFAGAIGTARNAMMSND